MPKFIQNILCLSVPELEECGVRWKAIESGFRRSTPYWQRVEDPTDSRRVWVAYEPMKARYKGMVEDAIGDVKALAQRLAEEGVHSKLMKLAQPYHQASDYEHYRYGKKLSHARATGLAQAAQWMRFLSQHRTKTHVRALELEGVETRRELIATVCEAIADEPPQALSVKGRMVSPARLAAKVREFQKKEGKEALECLVSGKIGNQNTAKIKSQEQEALLRQLYGRHQAFNYVAIRNDYNAIASKKGWKKIGRTTVANWCEQYRKQVGSTRAGLGVYKNEVDFIVKGSRPSAPLLRIESDGTPWELHYKKPVKGKNGKVVMNPWGRMVAVVVLDTYNDYPLGYALGEQETGELIQEAYRNAIHHIKELTGDYYLPHQIKADHFSKKEMGEMYRALAHYENTFATVGNAREKRIEGWFSQSKEKHLTKFHNFSGYNITAKREQPNRQYLDKISDTFPEEDGLRTQFDIFINACRNEVKKNGKTVKQQWLEGFNAYDNHRKASRKMVLDILGETTGYTNRLTNKGVEITIAGMKRTYMLYDHKFYNTLGTGYTIKYDLQDLNTVLAVSPDDKELYVLEQVEAIPMALADMTEQDQKNLQKMLAFKGREKRLTLLGNAKDFKTLEEMASSDEEVAGLLKDQFAGKHLQQRAEDLMKGASRLEDREQKPSRQEQSKDVDEGFSPSQYLDETDYIY